MALLARVQLARKDYKAAESEFLEILKIDPWDYQGDYQVQAELLAGCQRSPDSSALLVELASFHLKADQTEQALSSVPGFWVAANGPAFLLCEYQRTEESLARALKLATSAHRLKAGNPAILDTLGWIYYHQGNHQQAMKIFEEIARQIPENDMVNYNLAMVLMKSGREEEARSRLEHSLKDKSAFPGRADAGKALKMLKTKS